MSKSSSVERVRTKPLPRRKGRYIKYRNGIPERHRITKTKKIVKEPTLEELKVAEKAAAKTHWNPNFVRVIYHMALLGATNEMIASALDIGLSTLQKWQAEKDIVREAIKKGKEIADAKVANSLYESAIGFEHDDEVILTNRVKEFNEFGKVISERVEPLRVKTRKKYPPNVKAALKILAVRHPDVWGEKKVEQNNQVNITQINYNDFSYEELLLLSKLGVNQIVKKEGEDAEKTLKALMSDNEVINYEDGFEADAEIIEED